MRFLHYASRGLTVLAVAFLVANLADCTLAQYAPYGNSYQGYQPQQNYRPGPAYQPQQAYGVQYNNGGSQFMPGPQRTQPQYNSRSPYMAQPQYVAMSQQSSAGNLPAMTPSLETVPTGPMQQGNYPQQSAPMEYAPNNYSQGGYESYSAGGCATGNCGNGAGYACDGYGNYNQPNYGCCDTSCCRPCRHWFGGVYGLLMDRVTCGNGNLVYQTNVNGPGHYPSYDEVAMTYQDVDNGVQGGAEVRFGASFACCGGSGGYGGGCCNTCGGCNSGCGCGTLGWEAAYWGLAEDTTYAMVVDADNYAVDGNMTYGMKNFNRLRHNGGGGGWRPVNHYFSYGVPTSDYWSRVRQHRSAGSYDYCTQQFLDAERGIEPRIHTPCWWWMFDRLRRLRFVRGGLRQLWRRNAWVRTRPLRRRMRLLLLLRTTLPMLDVPRYPFRSFR